MNKFITALKKYLDIYLGQEMYFENDQKNLKFFHNNPTNTTAEDIRNKLGAIKDNTVSHSGLNEDMTAHILQLNIDPRLQKGDLSLVEDIAQFEARGQSVNALRFASEYCNFHRPDVFPIYSEQHFDFYRKYIAQQKLGLDPEKINTYPVFCKALNHLIEHLGMKGKMNYLQYRKFAWLYAESVLKESVEDGE